MCDAFRLKLPSPGTHVLCQVYCSCTTGVHSKLTMGMQQSPVQHNKGNNKDGHMELLKCFQEVAKWSAMQVWLQYVCVHKQYKVQQV